MFDVYLLVKWRYTRIATMMKIFAISIASLFALPGLFLALFNWYSISVWVWRKYQNPRYRKDPEVVSDIGGFLLFISVMLYMYAVPGRLNAWWVLAPVVVDYGALPRLVLTPLLVFLLHSRKVPAKGKASKPPFCKEVQLDFPLLLLGEDEFPVLVCNSKTLSRQVAKPGAVLYAGSLCQHVVNVTPHKKSGFWARLWLGTSVSFGAAEVEYTTPRPYKLGKLLKLQSRRIREDDDVLTQFHEASELLPLLKQCSDFHELIVLGCMAGWWEAPAGSGLPGLCDSDLNMERIRTECSRLHFV